MTNVKDAHTRPAKTITVACEINKHYLCDGTGTHVDTGGTVQCECYCHKERMK